MARTYAVLVGIVLALVGVLGFVKTELFGLHFNTTHNAVHLLSGIIGVGAGMSGAGASRVFARVFGVIYTLVAIAGFAGVPAVLSTMLNLNLEYNAIHLAVGLLGLLAGFAGDSSTA